MAPAATDRCSSRRRFLFLFLYRTSSKIPSPYTPSSTVLLHFHRRLGGRAIRIQTVGGTYSSLEKRMDCSDPLHVQTIAPLRLPKTAIYTKIPEQGTEGNKQQKRSEKPQSRSEIPEISVPGEEIPAHFTGSVHAHGDGPATGTSNKSGPNRARSAANCYLPLQSGNEFHVEGSNNLWRAREGGVAWLGLSRGAFRGRRDGDDQRYGHSVWKERRRRRRRSPELPFTGGDRSSAGEWFRGCFLLFSSLLDFFFGA